MSVAELLLAYCNEFYAAVTPWEQKRNAGLNLLFKKVKKNIENGLEGFSDEQELKLVNETIGDLGELMDQISDDEKNRKPKLKKRFDEIEELIADLRAEMLEGSDDGDSSDYPESDTEEDFEDVDDPDDDWNDEEMDEEEN